MSVYELHPGAGMATATPEALQAMYVNYVRSRIEGNLLLKRLFELDRGTQEILEGTFLRIVGLDRNRDLVEFHRLLRIAAEDAKLVVRG